MAGGTERARADQAHPRQPVPPAGYEPNRTRWAQTDHLNAFPGTIGWFLLPGDPTPLHLGLSDGLPPDPTYQNFLLGGLATLSTPNGGTVTVTSETLATPLPAAFPLFGSALAGLGGVGWIRKKRVKVSHNRRS
jgi:hypothetical protein